MYTTRSQIFNLLADFDQAEFCLCPCCSRTDTHVGIIQDEGKGGCFVYGLAYAEEGCQSFDSWKEAEVMLLEEMTKMDSEAFNQRVLEQLKDFAAVMKVD